MHTKKILLTAILIFNFVNIFSQEVLTNSVNVQFTVIPTFTTIDLTRGLSLDWINSSNNYNWGLSVRVLNKDYTSIKGVIGFDIDISKSLDIPLYLGGGFKVKNVSISSENTEGFALIVAGTTGVEFRYSEDWSYTILGVFDYQLNNKMLIPHIGIGVKYRF